MIEHPQGAVRVCSDTRPTVIGLALEYFEVDVAWMIGNSAESDIGAADAAGIPSVLVVRDRPAPLVEAATLVLSSS